MSKKDDTEKIRLTNAQVWLLLNSEGMQRIARSLDLDMKTGNAVYSLIHTIQDANETKVLQDTIRRIVQKHGVEDERGQKRLMGHPEQIELFEKDSGIEVERFKVSMKQVRLSVADRIELEWLIDFVE